MRARRDARMTAPGEDLSVVVTAVADLDQSVVRLAPGGFEFRIDGHWFGAERTGSYLRALAQFALLRLCDEHDWLADIRNRIAGRPGVRGYTVLLTVRPGLTVEGVGATLALAVAIAVLAALRAVSA